MSNVHNDIIRDSLHNDLMSDRVEDLIEYVRNSNPKDYHVPGNRTYNRLKEQRHSQDPIGQRIYARRLQTLPCPNWYFCESFALHNRIEYQTKPDLT